MGWLQRLFGMEQTQDAQVNPTPTSTPTGGGGGGGATAETIPAERMGPTGEYDESGLAKRVALAFDNTPELKDLQGLFVAQTGSTVVLKGKAPDQATLDRLVEVARGVSGTTDVTVDQVSIGG
jgi:hypothetical protein